MLTVLGLTKKGMKKTSEKIPQFDTLGKTLLNLKKKLYENFQLKKNITAFLDWP